MKSPLHQLSFNAQTTVIGWSGKKLRNDKQKVKFNNTYLLKPLMGILQLQVGYHIWPNTSEYSEVISRLIWWRVAKL